MLWRNMLVRDTGTLLREGPAHRAPLPPTGAAGRDGVCPLTSILFA